MISESSYYEMPCFDDEIQTDNSFWFENRDFIRAKFVPTRMCDQAETPLRDKVRLSLLAIYDI